MKKVDYIIVGLGLAGIAFVEELIKHNKTFMVFDDASQTSSKIAGGVYNPVILKRFTPAWNGHEQMQTLFPFYKELSTRLGVHFDTKFSTKKIFTSVKDQNNWFIALDKPNLGHYMQPNITKEKIEGVKGDFGFGTLTGTGKIDTKKLINSYKTFLTRMASFSNKQFKYDHLELVEKEIYYEGIICNKIVFCEGYGLKNNPFFNYLPLTGTKGEVLTIHAPDLNIDFLLKSSVFVLPLGDDYYKVGATFNWTDKTSLPTLEGKEELVQKLANVISVSYTITGHSAGIRPTVKDRRPLVGIHPKHDTIAVLNGLGTRGVMVAPTMAEHLFNHLENNIPLDKEISIDRFDSYYVI